MFSISFKKSRSKNYKEVLSIIANFNHCCVENDVHIVDIEIKELFQKWEFFNLLFWRTVDWKGSSFTFDDIELFSHTDKTRIFYALQQSHNEWINMYVDFAKNLYAIHKEEKNIEEVRLKAFKEKDIDAILDRYLRNVNKKKYYEQFGHLNFDAPLANSDFHGKKVKRTINNKYNTDNQNSNS